MVQKYSFIKVEGTFITCNNKIITASASASATGNTIEESDNVAYMYAKQNLEISAQQNASENNLILKKLLKIKTVIATNDNPDNIIEIDETHVNDVPDNIIEIDETHVNDVPDNIIEIDETHVNDNPDNIIEIDETHVNDDNENNMFHEVDDEMLNNILEIEEMPSDTISNFMEMEIRDEIEYILDNQTKLQHPKTVDICLPKNI